jgi:hypothetical protein
MEEDISICNVCGEKTATKEKTTWVVQVPYGSIEHFTFTSFKCSSCKEEIMGDDYDAGVVPALNKSRKASVINMLHFFEQNHYKRSTLERIFGLNQGDIDKYLEADVIEPSFVMLMLTYRSFFPGLFDAADSGSGFNRCTIYGPDGVERNKDVGEE